MIAIICIVFLMAVALFLIRDSRRAHNALDQVMPTLARLALRAAHFENELEKYHRKRDSRGRFIRGDL